MLRRLFACSENSHINSQIASTTAILMNYLPIADQLSWRTTCRANREAVQKAQRGPYRSKPAFAMAVTGLFYARTTTLLAKAWRYYARIIRSESMKPAMLYRLGERRRRNPRFTQKLIHFKAGENIEQQTRVYQPLYYDHFWSYNLVWMLAQIHKGRAFVVLSDITSENLKSKSKWFAPSAFAKEIVTALLAGYRAQAGRDDNIELIPPDLQVTSSITLADLQMEKKIIKEKYSGLLSLQKLEQGPQVSHGYYSSLRRRK